MPTPTYEPTNIAYLQNLDSYHPLQGKCLLRLHRHNQFTPGGLIVPEVARDLKLDNKSFFATVLSMTPRTGWDESAEGFSIGDTVIVMLRLEDLSRADGLLITSNTRVYAVVENYNSDAWDRQMEKDSKTGKLDKVFNNRD